MPKNTFADIKKRKKPVVRKVQIALDGEKADEFNAARGRLETVEQQIQDNPRDKSLQLEKVEAQEAYDALYEGIKDDVVEFVFRSVGRRRYEEILAECAPTPKQKKEALEKGEDEPAWNDDTFPPALIAACLVSPELTEEEVFEIWESEDWNQQEIGSMFLAAIGANNERKVVDLGKGSGSTPA